MIYYNCNGSPSGCQGNDFGGCDYCKTGIYATAPDVKPLCPHCTDKDKRIAELESDVARLTANNKSLCDRKHHLYKVINKYQMFMLDVKSLHRNNILNFTELLEKRIKKIDDDESIR